MQRDNFAYTLTILQTVTDYKMHKCGIRVHEYLFTQHTICYSLWQCLNQFWVHQVSYPKGTGLLFPWCECMNYFSRHPAPLSWYITIQRSANYEQSPHNTWLQIFVLITHTAHLRLRSFYYHMKLQECYLGMTSEIVICHTPKWCYSWQKRTRHYKHRRNTLRVYIACLGKEASI